MAEQLTDAEIVAHIRDIVADEAKLETHYRDEGRGDSFAQASAFVKIRRFLEAQAEIQSRT